MNAAEDPGRILSESVYARLRAALMRAELKPHSRLKVRDLARQMGTSETPVREALVQLAHDGAIEIKPRFYIRVRRLTLAEYLEIRDIRLALEPMAAERALPRIGKGDIAALEAAHGRLVAAEAAGEWGVALEANFAFHFGLYEKSGVTTLTELLHGLWMRAGPMLSELYPGARPTYPDEHQHLAVLDALRRRDAPVLRMAISQDLIEGGRRLVRHLASLESPAAGGPPSPAPKRIRRP